MTQTLMPPKDDLDAALYELSKRPENVDFYALMRYIDAACDPKARLGYSLTPREDAVRLGQYPSTAFAPTTIFSIDLRTEHAPPMVRILSVGLFGPNGPLPLHITEYVRERIRTQGDNTLAAFADMFHHRILSLFYRAWADAQPAVQLDRPGQNNFDVHVGSLTGLGFKSTRRRDSIADQAKLFASGQFVRLTRNPEGLCKVLAHFFDMRAYLHEYIRTTITIPPQEQTRLTGRNIFNQLGMGAISGERFSDVQSRFRVELGPMSLQKYELFLPGFSNNLRLRDWVRLYVGVEFGWDAELVLKADEVPSSVLGAGQRLGWTTWLGTRSSKEPARDLRINPERDNVRFAQEVVYQ